MVRSRLVTGIAAVTAVAVGGIGGAVLGVPALSGAQQFPHTATAAATTVTGTPGGPGARGQRTSPLLDAAAKALNLTTQQLMTKLSDGKTTIADIAKQENVDIKTVTAAMAAADQGRIDDIVNNPWPTRMGGPGGGPGKGFGGPMAGGPAAGAPAFGFGIGRLGGMAFTDVAKALGISTDELKTDLGKGESIAAIAKAKNVDINTVINTLVGEANTKIDAEVTAGHLTAAQAAKLKASLKTLITNAVNGTRPKFPMGGRGFGGFGGHRGGHNGPDPSTGNGTPPTTTAPSGATTS